MDGGPCFGVESTVLWHVGIYNVMLLDSICRADFEDFVVLRQTRTYPTGDVVLLGFTFW